MGTFSKAPTIGDYAIFFNRLIFCPVQWPRLQKSNDLTGLHFVYFNRLLLHYLFGQYHDAVASADLASQYLQGVRSKVFVALTPFYEALARLAIFDGADANAQADILTRVTLIQAKLQRWAQHAPMNYLHRWHLVEAERARVEHRALDAMDHYDRAIALAREHEWLHEVAIANELAGQFWLARDKRTFAAFYLTAAYNTYQQWGAEAKVSQFATRYSAYLSHPQTRRLSSGELSKTTQEFDIDVETVVKASQTLSSALCANTLLTDLLQLALQNAGAQHGYLLAERSGNWCVEIATTFEAHPTIPSYDDETLRCPLAIVHYVHRTGEALVISNAARDSRFQDDPRVRDHHIRSVVCLPLKRQGDNAMLLYLENNLSEGAFTPERVKVLEMLMAQVAISLENARLYSELQHLNTDLEHRVQERTQQLQKAQQDLIAQAHRAGMADIAANVLHNVGNVLNSVTTSASVIATTVNDSHLNKLFKANDLLRQQGDRLDTFVTQDDKAVKLMRYYLLLDDQLRQEQDEVLGNIEVLHEKIQLINEIVVAQQSYAQGGGLEEALELESVVELALTLQGALMERHGVLLERDYARVGTVLGQKTKLVHVLVNVLKNATEAMSHLGIGEKQLRVSLDTDGAWVQLSY